MTYTRSACRVACPGEEIDQLIEHTSTGLMTREESIRMWQKTYDSREDAAYAIGLCRPCVEAIVDLGFED